VTTLITVFGNQTKLGIVRSAIARHGPALRDLLEDSTLAASYANAQDGDLMLSPLPHGAFHEALPEAPPMPQPESKSPLSFFVFNEASTPPSPLPAPAAGFAMEDAFLAHAVRFSPFIPLPPLQPSESNGVSE
jgi:hypothetical protein